MKLFFQRVVRSSIHGVRSVGVVAYKVLGEKLFFQKGFRSSGERCARLCLGRTLAGRGGPNRGDGTVRWAACVISGRSQSGGGRRQPPCAPMPELGMKVKGAEGR